MQLGLNKLACTSTLCSWKKARRKATPAPLKKIDFSRPKIGQRLPRVHDNQGIQGEKPFSFEDPMGGADEFKKRKLTELRKLTGRNVAIFSSLDIEDSPNSDTDTADEDDENEVFNLPEPMTALFCPSSINYDDSVVNEQGRNLYAAYKTTQSQKMYSCLAKVTSTQAKSKVWKLHRAGRITASVAKAGFSVHLGKHPKSFINKVMQYNDEVNTAATNHGKEMEPEAKKDLFDLLKQSHQKFSMVDTGLHILSDFPFLGASPDGLVNCDCHGMGVIEIKCPYKYRYGLTGWESDKDFPIDAEGHIKMKHRYFFQIQLQMHLTKTQYCYFFTWTAGNKKNESILATVKKDEMFCQTMVEKLSDVFFKILLPELITRKHDPKNCSEKQHCSCQRPSFPPMITCNGKSCKFQYFHYSCVGLKNAPRAQWYCMDCKEIEEKI